MDQPVEETTSPRLISTGDIKDIRELCLASEGMVVCKFRPPSILSAVATLLGSFYCFNMEFPKVIGGSGKNVFLFLEYIFPHIFIFIQAYINVFRVHAVRSD